jgi:ketosteroid isomerase-like protein
LFSRMIRVGISLAFVLVTAFAIGGMSLFPAGAALPVLRSANIQTADRGDAGSRASAKTTDESQIRAVLEIQEAAWNRGDIDAFMKYYWRSQKTLFVGANGVTRGWQAVLDRYYRTYPNLQAMGRLTFSNIEVHQDCARAAVVIGEYHLQRQKDNPSGVFTLNFRKFPEGWRIVVDHTTAFSSQTQHVRNATSGYLRDESGAK